MRDVLPDLLARWRAGEQVGLASVVATRGSAPREPGAAMFVASDGDVFGSISGGCVEGAVYDVARRVAADSRCELLRYTVSDDDAYAIGLTCGGTIDVFVEPVGPDTFPALDGVAADIDSGRPVAVAVVVSAPIDDHVGRRLIVRPHAVTGSLGDHRVDAAVRDDALAVLGDARSATSRYATDAGDYAVFVASYAPAPRLIVFGATDFAVALSRVGALLGYRVTVCDARAAFATTRRFPDADEVVVDWPHRYLASTPTDVCTAVCVLTHDAKFDVPLLAVALRLPLAYLGAMGSRRTNDVRTEELLRRGFDEDDLARLRAPIGLDLGGRTPEETAVSVAAEIVATRRRGSGVALRDRPGPIHLESAP